MTSLSFPFCLQLLHLPHVLVYTILRYNNASSTPHLAILGLVFDVSLRKDIYGGEGGYSFFSGIDGTKAFITGKRREYSERCATYIYQHLIYVSTHMIFKQSHELLYVTISSFVCIGNFTKEGLIDDISSLSPSDCLSLYEWLHDTYFANYKFKGRVIGYFFTEEGRPTEGNALFHQMKAEGVRVKKEIEDERVRYPGCNARWTPQTGGMYGTRQ